MELRSVKKELILKNGHRIAYCKTDGREPCVIFFSGFKSDMTGTKATALEAFCAARGQAFVRFDYSGHGQSSGEFTEGTIGAWKHDALQVLDQLGGDKNILIGSSMGAWIALLVARERMNRVAGFIGIASAPDFTEQLIWEKLSAVEKSQLVEQGVYYAPSCYGQEPYPITRTLIEEARQHLLLTGNRQLATGHFPIRLIHGTNDEDVPWQHAVKLMEQLPGTDVTLTLIKGGNHRLSEAGDLQTLCEALGRLMQTMRI